MTTAAPLAQFPWPLVVGALVGLVLAVAVSVRGLVGRGPLKVVALVAAALTGMSVGAFLALVWLWVGPMSRPVGGLFSFDSQQFLSTEQLRQIVVMTDLAWILPLASLFFGAIAAWLWRRD